ncbi:protein SOB FIVE-LIKE 6-like [Salvia hispanica]|uniref:protein SOB FIVE-LIKE 6-like n=1 Tax=Salvia hispanica TaxID=49212 RepID=UPI002009C21B|nr:protein SOB FIVE-LIKE 6-like [Salvia hispanica]
MNTSTSDCTSGSESGWTTYLVHPSNSTSPYTHYTHHQGKGANAHDQEDEDEDDRDEEDLSMVSDASSGPPHFPAPSQAQQDKKQKSKPKEIKLKKNKKQHSLCLDDTASSHFLQEESKMPKKKIGFLKSSGSLLGRKRQ